MCRKRGDRGREPPMRVTPVESIYQETDIKDAGAMDTQSVSGKAWDHYWKPWRQREK